MRSPHQYTPRAYVRVIGSGRRSAMICDPCTLTHHYDGVAAARTAARDHNRNHHPEETR